MLDALNEGHERQATALMFGQRFDSLSTVLQRVLREEGDAAGSLDAVSRYLILLCGQQLVETIRTKASEFWAKFPDQSAEITTMMAERLDIRKQIIAQDPERLAEFMDWFDRWFLQRAEPVALA